MGKILLIAMTLFCCGCASVITKTQDPKAFAVCKAADVITTHTAISSGVAHEANPLIASTLAHGYFPMIAIGFAMYEGLKYLNNPIATEVATITTCGAAVGNARIIMQAK